MGQLRKGTALALSGGGFRATLFHLGSIIRINELGLLGKLERISSVSGGSITAARLAATWHALDFRNGTAENLKPLVIDPLLRFCNMTIDRPVVLLGMFSPFHTISELLVKRYEEHVCGDFRLQDLPDRPRFVFNATNLQTGRLFRISKPYMADYSIGRVPAPDLPLALAVAASSAFPPLLSPVVIESKGMRWEDMKGTTLFTEAKYREKLYLTDGGAYDNLGLETADDFSCLLVSDAGAPFAMRPEKSVSWLHQTQRALDIATDQSRGLRKRRLFENASARGQTVALWAIDTDIHEYNVPDVMPTNPAYTKPLAVLATRLAPFGEENQARLVNWGYVLADAALRRWCPGLPAATPSWPMPRYPL